MVWALVWQAITNMALKKVMNDLCIKQQEKEEEVAKVNLDWSIFKKYDVIPLTKRPEAQKTVKTSKTSKT